MRLVEFFKLTEKKKVVPLDKGNPHDDADEADWNNPGTFGMTQHGYSFSPEEHPGILLPGEVDPEGSDDIDDPMVVVKKT